LSALAVVATVAVVQVISFMVVRAHEGAVFNSLRSGIGGGDTMPSLQTHHKEDG
jgi:hypothetical protein